jgi:hypothetical protein
MTSVSLDRGDRSVVALESLRVSKVIGPFEVKYVPGEVGLLRILGYMPDYWVVIDRNGIEVAMCLTRQEAKDMAYKYNTHFFDQKD